MRQINVTVSSCQECPYCQYNGDYGRSYDSGYDCRHPESPMGRIVDDWDVNNINNPNPKGWPEIPTQCPLTKIN